MKTVEVKTNIMYSSCVAKVAQVLDEIAGKENWNVEIQNPTKILTVITEDLTEDEVIRAVQKAGYKAEKLS